MTIKLSKETFKYLKSSYEKCTNCKLCVKNCPMLESYGGSPKDILKKMTEDKACGVEMAYSCTNCSYCDVVCNKGVSLDEIFEKIKKDAVLQYNKVPVKKGRRVLETHQRNSFSRFFSHKLNESTTHEVVFFPGCSLVAQNPKMVKEVYEFLKEEEKNLKLHIKCCGKPTQSMGDKEKFLKYYSELDEDFEKMKTKKVITACSNCFNTIKENSEDIEVISIWEEISKRDLSRFKRKSNKKVKFALHDPCPTRKETQLHDSIRKILQSVDVEFEEFEYSREKTLCCGSGSMLMCTSKELAFTQMKKRANQTNREHIVTYCQECVESMKRGGKKSVHILDLLFNKDIEKNEFDQIEISTLKKWINRYSTVKTT